MTLGEHDLTHQTARAIIELLNPMTRTHASALAPCKGNQGVEVMRICRAQCRYICLAGFVRINEIGTARLKDVVGWRCAVEVPANTTNTRNHIWVIKIEAIHHLYMIGKLTPEMGLERIFPRESGLKLANFSYS